MGAKIQNTKVHFLALATTRIDKTAAIDAADSDERLPSAISDAIIADNGEFYDDGDLTTRHLQKRAGSPIETAQINKRNKSNIPLGFVLADVHRLQLKIAIFSEF